LTMPVPCRICAARKFRQDRTTKRLRMAVECGGKLCLLRRDSVLDGCIFVP